MSSSVTRMPTLEVGPLPSPASSSTSSSSIPKVNTRRKSKTTTTTTTVDSDTANSKRRTQVLDRWAAQQAREMTTTTIERKAHNAELSALSTTTTRPISARAASFLCETSPSFLSDTMSLSSVSSSVTSSSSSSSSSSQTLFCGRGGGGDKVDVRPNVRASSLIQMWRELEAEAGVGTQPRDAGGGCGGGGGFGFGSERKTGGSNNCVGNNNLVKFRCRREVQDLVERMREDREREVGAVQEMKKVAKFSHRGRIQAVLKLKFLRKELQFQEQARSPTSRKTTSRRTEPDRSKNELNIILLRERFDHRNKNSDNGVPIRERSSSIDIPPSNKDSKESGSPPHSLDQINVDNSQPQEVISIRELGSSPPGAITPLSATLGPDDRSQITEFSLLHSVSEEVHGGCQGLELHSLHCGSDYLREGSQSPEVSSPDSVNPDLISMNSVTEFLQEGCLSPEPSPSQFIIEDPSQSSNASWDERTLWESNLDWQSSMVSQNSSCWQSEREVAREDREPYSEVLNTSDAWMNESYISWRSWATGEEYHDFIENFSDNMEIRELLARRKVTTSLESDFCVKMNRMIMSVLQKQEQQYVDEDFAIDYVEQPPWRHNYELDFPQQNNYELENAGEPALDSSLVPSSYESHYPDCSQQSSLSHRSSQDQQDSETVHSLRSEMAQMQEEINHLRKLVESCMGWQTKLQDSIKEEISASIRQSVIAATTSEFSKCTLVLKNNCCICNEMPVDSLLYRCGHMCTCFDCAHELQWKNGACPICKAPIADVVRAHLNP